MVQHREAGSGWRVGVSVLGMALALAACGSREAPGAPAPATYAMDDFAKVRKFDAHVHAKSVNGDAFEAVMGAIYLDLGYEKTKEIFIQRILMTQLDLESLLAAEKNFKSKVLAWTQKRHLPVSYLHEEQGNQNKKLYKAILQVDGKPVAEGLGYTVKQAEQAAAEQYCAEIDS